MLDGPLTKQWRRPGRAVLGSHFGEIESLCGSGTVSVGNGLINDFDPTPRATYRVVPSSLAKSIGLVMWAANPASRLRRMSSSMP
jgi:hypothetical protein